MKLIISLNDYLVMCQNLVKRKNILITLKPNQVVGTPTAESKTEHRVIVLYSCLMRIHIDGRYC